VWHNIEDVPLTFGVGDGEITMSSDGTEYYNRRLSECTTYGVFYYIRLQSDTGCEVCYWLVSAYVWCDKIICKPYGSGIDIRI